MFRHPDFWNPLKTAPLAARWGVRFIRRQYDLLSKLVTPDTVLVARFDRSGARTTAADLVEKLATARA